MTQITSRKPAPSALLTHLVRQSISVIAIVSILLLALIAVSATVALQRVERADQIAARV